MSSNPLEPADLLDLKLLPSWLKESERPVSYEHYAGDEGDDRFAKGGGRDRERRPPGRSRKPSSRPDDRRTGKGRPDKRPSRGPRRPGDERTRPPREGHREPAVQEDLSGRLSVRFIPYGPALENVVSQIKSNPVSYSVFALARLFLEKPERYEVRLSANEGSPAFHQLGENGGLSLSRELLETNAFRSARDEFYRVEVTQGEPVKGNFPTVARCRLSGIILGPTNHHAYQSRLRALYDQRFSRRMSFPEYQRQIEIVNDAAVVEQWKEEARNVTTFTTLKEEPPLTFQTPSEAERHFRIHYLPTLVQEVTERTLGGVQSRQLQDRTLGRFIEASWSKEIRSPSQMMQELSSRLRDSGLQIFRHRRGMLFVTGVRPKPFAHQAEQGVSAQVQKILETLATDRGIKRKELAYKVLGETPSEDGDQRKLSLASDLRWLISAGHVIEFNDGSLDLPRVKPPQSPEAEKGTDVSGVDNEEPAQQSSALETISESPSAAPSAEVTSETSKPEGEEL